LALRRAYDLNDEDDAMDDLIDVTTRAAINMGCPAPLVTFDLWLADDVINQLASEEYPFVAALAPSWTHQAVRPAIVSLLESGTSPEELFSTDEYEIHRHLHRRHGENGRAIELIPVEFVAQAPTALFIVSVSDEAFPYFLARPMVADDSSAEQRATAAASLVERALAVGPVNPLQSLGLERFKAGENGTERWQRMMTVVQAYVTFHYLDIQKQKTGAP
jgi:hypothetical protein